MFEVNSIVINVDAARKYLQEHERKLEKMRRKYIKQLCKDIKREAKRGSKVIYTKTLRESFMTYEYMMELKEYFEKQGFTVKEEGNNHGALTSWLEIRWGN